MRKLITLVASCGISFALILGCTPGKAVDTQFNIDGGTVAVHVPPIHGTIGVVALHSLDHGGTEPAAQGWTKASDKYGFTAIYPDNGGISWNAGLCCGYAMTTNRDDVTFLADVIQQVKARYHLTTIYIEGYSNGGMMAERLVAERPSLTRRIAVWGAAPEMPTPGRWPGSALLYRGAGDTTVPYNGGYVKIDDITYQFRAALSTSHWLVGASLKGMQAKGYGHAPAPDWPDIAWAFLNAR
jgi:polyhydroxybutyrate depolymerase